MAAAEEESCEEKNISKFKAGSFVAGVTIVSLFAGFGLTLGRAKKKSPADFGDLGANKLALKALGFGTLLSLSGCGLFVLTLKWMLGVRNVSEFSSMMKKNLPEKEGEFVKKFEAWKLPRTSNAEDENEWEEMTSK